DGKASSFFWDAVVYHHTFATGGHGYDESFGPADKLSGQVDGTVKANGDTRSCESCNVYNMMKFTRTLFSIKPDDKYSEFLERGLFNHVLASIDPATGQTCYMVSVGVNVTHEYQNMQSSFTCCVGTGYESHALHADGMYDESANGDRLWVNLYAPSTANWRSAGLAVSMDTAFPIGDTASLKVSKLASVGPLPAAGERTISLRRPLWAGEGFAIKVNGTALANLPAPGSFVDIKRPWADGDTVTLEMPKTLHTEPLPDNPNRMALMWGPLVLAGDLGTGGGRGGGGGGRRGAGGAGNNNLVFVTADKSITHWLKPVAGKPGTFEASTAGNQPITFVPFYQLAQHRYGIYWDVYTPQEWSKQSPEYAAQMEAQDKIAKATVSFAQPGQMQPETDHNFAGENTQPIIVADQPGRRGTGWFSMELAVDGGGTSQALVVTYSSTEEKKRNFDILIDGTKLASQTIDPPADGAAKKFYDQTYNIPKEMVAGKQKVTVKFQAAAESETAGVFGIRVVRTAAP
ncbi:MAG TPA: beta-L-arabinofuranosidase domain-containing protein, partial [Phycisphaerae bacterium]